VPKSWSKVRVESSGKYRIRMHHDNQEQDLDFEYNSEQEADSAIEEFKQAPTNGKVITHKPAPKPKSW
jgi:uncharacterized protein YegP (UPF0339 family)